MATLLHARSGDTYTLHSENLVGRKSKCDICLHNRQVSGAHAELRWTEQGWVIHDLDSRNGTYVNHRRLERGERLAIEAGAIVAFADSEDRFKLVDDSPPAAHAVSAGGQICESSGRIFVLPDTGPYECTVYERNSGWYVEERDSGASRPVTDGEVLTVGSEPWTLHLPVIVDSTWNPGASSPLLGNIALRFSVSFDEEHITLTLLHSERSTCLNTRVYMELLLRLAEKRLDDERDSLLPRAEKGWIDVKALLRQLGWQDDATRRNLLYQHIHQARKHFEKAGVVGAVDIIQRRATIVTERSGRIGQLRIGVSKIDIERRQVACDAEVDQQSIGSMGAGRSR